MPCNPLYAPNGQLVGFACSRGSSRKLCGLLNCGKPESKLCDFVIRKEGNKQITCDMPLCAAHATSGGKNIDYCPKHAKQLGLLKPDSLTR